MSFISRKRMREEGEDRGIRDNRNIVGEKDYTREKKTGEEKEINKSCEDEREGQSWKQERKKTSKTNI